MARLARSTGAGTNWFLVGRLADRARATRKKAERAQDDRGVGV